MKKIILALILINAILCSSESCGNEKTQSNCKAHDITEYNDFSCYKIKNSYTIESDDEEDEDVEEEEGCFPFPNDANSQKSYINLSIGITKELFSLYYTDYQYSGIDGDTLKELYFPYEESAKASYGIDDQIIISGKQITDEELKILKSKNTCGYLLLGRYSDEATSNPNLKGYPNINDKNICFKASKFPEVKDLIDCGYAEIKYKINDEEYKINTCFYLPNDKLPENIIKIYKEVFIDQIIEDGDGIMDILFSAYTGDEEDEDYNDIKEKRMNIIKKIGRIGKRNTGRSLAEAASYQIIVEGKTGKKIQYKSGSTEIEVIAKGSQSNSTNQSGILRFNYIILLILILLCL